MIWLWHPVEAAVLAVMLVLFVWLALWPYVFRPVLARVLLILGLVHRYRQRWLGAVKQLELLDEERDTLAQRQRLYAASLSESEAARRALVDQVAALSLEVAELELRLDSEATATAVARANLNTAQQLQDEIDQEKALEARRRRESAGWDQIIPKNIGARQTGRTRLKRAPR